jgi:hypothetical protein
MGGTLTKGDRPIVQAAGRTGDRTAEDNTQAHDVGLDTEVERRVRRLAAREFHSRRRPLSLAAALVMLIAGGLASIEVVSGLLSEPVGLVPFAHWADGLSGTAWQDATVRLVAAAVAVLGALVGLRALLPRRHPRMMAMQNSDPLMAAAVSRQAVRRSLTEATTAVPGIVRARVRMGGRLRRRVSVRAVTRYRNPANLTDLVRAAVTARLAELDLMDAPPVRVRLRWRKD